MIGVAAMTHFLSVREKFHSNMLVQMNELLTDKRVHVLTAGTLPHSTGPEEAQHRAVAILSQQVRAQAYTPVPVSPAARSSVLIAWVVLAYLLLMLVMRPGKITFMALKKMP